jgi:hypothetical protein
VGALAPCKRIGWCSSVALSLLYARYCWAPTAARDIAACMPCWFGVTASTGVHACSTSHTTLQHFAQTTHLSFVHTKRSFENHASAHAHAHAHEHEHAHAHAHMMCTYTRL